MTLEEFEILTHDKIKLLIEANIDQSPTSFALHTSHNEIPTALVSTQLKYLQKAKKKLPHYYKARCIIPGQAYEQASSELTASTKSFSGNSCLDMTMGLGVDTLHFAHRFDSVIALEPNPVLAEIGRHNMQLMGISNVKIITKTAEDFLESYQGLPFDLIYVDPSRRDDAGNRSFLLNSCQPRVDLLLPRMQALGKELLIKLSPLFDLQAAVHEFSRVDTLSILSIGNECKELLVHIRNKQSDRFPTSQTKLSLITFRQGMQQSFEFSYPLPEIFTPILPHDPTYLFEADVVFYKARAMPQLFRTYFPDIAGEWNDTMGFFFGTESPPSNFPGRVWQIQEVLPYKPKQIKKWLKQHQIRQTHLLRRHFPFSVKEIRKQLQLSEGGDIYLICTLIEGEKKVIVGKLYENGKR